jgi:SAM-dependent methyltransferase
MVAGAGAADVHSPALTALLRCPACGGDVEFGRDAVTCAASHRFPVVEGIPVFVGEELLGTDPQYAGQRRYFDAEFSGYERYELENWRRSYLERLFSRRLIGASGPLVDVGVGGSGYTVIEAARAGQAAIGCDLSLEALLKARRFAVEQDLGARTLWVCCSAEKLPLASGAFATALAVAVIEHVPDDSAALWELSRVLSPGGRAWITVPHALQHIALPFRLPNRLHDRRLGHLRRYDAGTLVEAARRVGLEVDEVQFTGHSIKVLQLVAARNERFWWWCERRDLARSRHPRGSMQLSAVFKHG